MDFVVDCNERFVLMRDPVCLRMCSMLETDVAGDAELVPEEAFCDLEYL